MATIKQYHPLIVKKILPITLLIALLISTSCGYNPFSNPLDMFGGSSGRDSVQPSRVENATGKFYLAIGGVQNGLDELILKNDDGSTRIFTGDSLVCTSSDESVATVEPRSGYDTQAAGSGVRIVPIASGIAEITCKSGGEDLGDKYEVTIPPQSLIQILLAEGGMQISDEANASELDDGTYSVALDSTSATATALASVIRNRIEKINDENDPSLFGVTDTDSYDSNTPASYYDAVINASGQFSPVSSSDASHDMFEAANKRDYLTGDWLIAYDQAVITSAQIFNGDLDDNTGKSFAFASPTSDEWKSLSDANASGLAIPVDFVFTDDTFPSLAPIQILIHPDIWTYSDGRPAFIFARERGDSDAAITTTP